MSELELDEDFETQGIIHLPSFLNSSRSPQKHAAASVRLGQLCNIHSTRNSQLHSLTPLFSNTKGRYDSHPNNYASVFVSRPRANASFICKPHFPTRSRRHKRVNRLQGTLRHIRTELEAQKELHEQLLQEYQNGFEELPEEQKETYLKKEHRTIRGELKRLSFLLGMLVESQKDTLLSRSKSQNSPRKNVNYLEILNATKNYTNVENEYIMIRARLEQVSDPQYKMELKERLMCHEMRINKIVKNRKKITFSLLLQEKVMVKAAEKDPGLELNHEINTIDGQISAFTTKANKIQEMLDKNAESLEESSTKLTKFKRHYLSLRREAAEIGISPDGRNQDEEQAIKLGSMELKISNLKKEITVIRTRHCMHLGQYSHEKSVLENRILDISKSITTKDGLWLLQSDQMSRVMDNFGGYGAEMIIEAIKRWEQLTSLFPKDYSYRSPREEATVMEIQEYSPLSLPCSSEVNQAQIHKNLLKKDKNNPRHEIIEEVEEESPSSSKTDRIEDEKKSEEKKLTNSTQIKQKDTSSNSDNQIISPENILKKSVIAWSNDPEELNNIEKDKVQFKRPNEVLSEKITKEKKQNSFEKISNSIDNKMGIPISPEKRNKDITSSTITPIQKDPIIPPISENYDIPARAITNIKSGGMKKMIKESVLPTKFEKAEDLLDKSPEIIERSMNRPTAPESTLEMHKDLNPKEEKQNISFPAQNVSLKEKYEKAKPEETNFFVRDPQIKPLPSATESSIEKLKLPPLQKIEKSPISDYPISKNDKIGVLQEKNEPQNLSPSPSSRPQVPIQEKDKNSTSVALSNPQANITNTNPKPEVKKVNLRETFKMDSLVIPPRKVAAKPLGYTQNIEATIPESLQMEKKEESKELMKSTLIHQPEKVVPEVTQSPVLDRVQQIAQLKLSVNEPPHDTKKKNEQLAENKLPQVAMQKSKKEILQEIPKSPIGKEGQAIIQEIPARQIGEEKQALKQEIPKRDISKEPKMVIQEIPKRVFSKEQKMIIPEIPARPTAKEQKMVIQEIPARPTAKEQKMVIQEIPARPTAKEQKMVIQEIPARPTAKEQKMVIQEIPARPTAKEQKMVIQEIPARPTAKEQKMVIQEIPKRSNAKEQKMVIQEIPTRKISKEPQTIIPEIPARKISKEPQTIIPEIPARKISKEPQTIIPEIPARKISKEPQTIIPEIPARKISKEPQTIIPEIPARPIAKEPKMVIQEIPARTTAKDQKMVIQEIPARPIGNEQKMTIQEIPAIKISKDPQTIIQEIPARTTAKEQKMVIQEIPARPTAKEQKMVIQEIPKRSNAKEQKMVIQEIPARTVANEQKMTIPEIPARKISKDPQTIIQEIPARKISKDPQTIIQEIPARKISKDPQTIIPEIPARQIGKEQKAQIQQIISQNEPSQELLKGISKEISNESPKETQRIQPKELLKIENKTESQHPLTRPHQEKQNEIIEKTQINPPKLPTVSPLKVEVPHTEVKKMQQNNNLTPINKRQEQINLLLGPPPTVQSVTPTSTSTQAPFPERSKQPPAKEAAKKEDRKMFLEMLKAPIAINKQQPRNVLNLTQSVKEEKKVIPQSTNRSVVLPLQNNKPIIKGTISDATHHPNTKGQINALQSTLAIIPEEKKQETGMENEEIDDSQKAQKQSLLQKEVLIKKPEVINLLENNITKNAEIGNTKEMKKINILPLEEKKRIPLVIPEYHNTTIKADNTLISQNSPSKIPQPQINKESINIKPVSVIPNSSSPTNKNPPRLLEEKKETIQPFISQAPTSHRKPIAPLPSSLQTQRINSPSKQPQSIPSPIQVPTKPSDQADSQKSSTNKKVPARNEFAVPQIDLFKRSIKEESKPKEEEPDDFDFL